VAGRNTLINSGSIGRRTSSGAAELFAVIGSATNQSPGTIAGGRATSVLSGTETMGRAGGFGIVLTSSILDNSGLISGGAGSQSANPDGIEATGGAGGSEQGRKPARGRENQPVVPSAQYRGSGATQLRTLVL
jgi:hypothetical protein